MGKVEKRQKLNNYTETIKVGVQHETNIIYIFF